MWSGPVGLAETNSRLIFSPANASVPPYDAPAVDDLRGDLALGAGVDGDVEEARAGDLDAGDAVGRRRAAR